jgi:hypothetical protein
MRRILGALGISFALLSGGAPVTLVGARAATYVETFTPFPAPTSTPLPTLPVPTPTALPTLPAPSSTPRPSTAPTPALPCPTLSGGDGRLLCPTPKPSTTSIPPTSTAKPSTTPTAVPEKLVGPPDTGSGMTGPLALASLLIASGGGLAALAWRRRQG